MLIGIVLIPPVLLKLASTGYRFARYYLGSRPYREKGAPLLPLRLLAPILVIATAVVFVTGVLLLLLGHGSDSLKQIHKVSFIVWGACFGVHFLAHLPKMLRSLRSDWTTAARRRIPGAGPRASLLAGSLLSGIVLAVLFLSSVSDWRRGPRF